MNIVHEYVLSIDAADGVLFGSNTNLPLTADSDVDLVLFRENKRSLHYVDKYRGYIFDVFEMSLEQAFHFLRLREPMWLSAFSTGKSLNDNPDVELLLSTARKIAEQPSKPNPLLLQKLLFQIEHAAKKLEQNQQNIYFYQQYAVHFINLVGEYVFLCQSKTPCGLMQKLSSLTQDFGPLSSHIRDFLEAHEPNHKQQHAESILRILSEYPTETIIYPLILSRGTKIENKQ